ncbi:PREDICTED: E3 ubiquitin-protein ligase TRIM22-like [Ceratotherium simum simum]|uniref:E3 ubiquitin-protein ligase TRIM22-like n=1 Tax=Ceratotherium simum simum TaxID=73337 RepID=A0ABM1CE72_CERSS|nr:PREDICTED: E3 ubiquitin-protein ligase TRIM22-like [Ceratotherium simum simum]
MASGILVGIKQEVSCPICLELLTEPLTLDCGHSFCQACITANHKESKIVQERDSSCPVCRISYQLDNLRPNRHLANIAERLREVNLSPEKEQKRDLCVRHEEKLLLFCKEDGKVICWLCERSQEHHGHHAVLMEEVAQEYQEKLQAVLQRLRDKQQEAEKLKADVREKRSSLKNQIENETQRVQAEFNQIRGILDCEEQKELLNMKNEGADGLHNLADAENELVQQSQLVRALISDVEHRLQGSTMEMLQDVNGIVKRSETLTLKKPKYFPMEQRKVSQASHLIEKLQVFKELTEVQCYWVDFMLNPVNTISGVVVSADQRQVRVVHPSPSRNIHPSYYSAFDVLGCQCFSSGKYYWEVDVSEKFAWILGVCSNERKFNSHWIFGFTFVPKVNPPEIYSRYRPQNGYWVIGLQNESEYKAFEDSSTSDPHVLTLSTAVAPRRVGVFLDYEACTVSFFNVTNHGSLIYIFSECCFSCTVYPYFNPLNCPGSITLCPPSS